MMCTFNQVITKHVCRHGYKAGFSLLKQAFFLSGREGGKWLHGVFMCLEVFKNKKPKVNQISCVVNEPECAYAWALMHHYLSVCDLTKNQTRQKEDMINKQTFT